MRSVAGRLYTMETGKKAHIAVGESFMPYRRLRFACKRDASFYTCEERDYDVPRDLICIVCLRSNS